MADNNTNAVINTNTVRMTEKQKVKEITDRLVHHVKIPQLQCQQYTAY